jgi:hypothetical protein
VSQIRRGGAETLNPLARTSRLPFRLVTDTATLIEANAALDSGERIASVYRRLNIAEAFGTNETQFRYYANNRHRYPPPVLPAAPSASAAEPDLRSLDDRIHTFGRLMQKVSAAFKDFDSGKLKHDQRLLITALAGEALASRLRELPPSILLGFLKDLTIPRTTEPARGSRATGKDLRPGHQERPKYGWNDDQVTGERRPRLPGEEIDWPPELPFIVRKLYGVDTFKDRELEFKRRELNEAVASGDLPPSALHDHPWARELRAQSAGAARETAAQPATPRDAKAEADLASLLNP